MPSSANGATEGSAVSGAVEGPSVSGFGQGSRTLASPSGSRSVRPTALGYRRWSAAPARAASATAAAVGNDRTATVTTGNAAKPIIAPGDGRGSDGCGPAYGSG